MMRGCGNMLLVKPTSEYEHIYRGFYNEWLQSGEPFVPYIIENRPEPFQTMLSILHNYERGFGVKPNWMKSSTYWLIDEGELVGVVTIRHELNDDLYNDGGHIVYGIRPSKRQRGYATEILRLALSEALAMGLLRVLLTCEASNIGSRKAIEANGGMPADDYVTDDGRIIKRYWIHLVDDAA